MDKKTGQRIKTLRIENGLTQEGLGEKLGLDRGTISKIERGENAPTAKTLVELKRIFNVSIDWILTGKGLKHPIDMDDELLEMIDDLKNNQTAMIKVLSFFYNYKAKNLSQFVKKKSKKMKNDSLKGQEGKNDYQ
ncbi:MAG: helix-turn-helix transcriptional regulator [Candidatus Aminicenantes bacterium]|nr:MAG: helix-turn-helix transcriptional regulator [Candidatus Aminicenantes bacterium]